MSEYKEGFEVGVLAGKSFERERIIAQLETEYWVWQDGTIDETDPRNKHLREVIKRVKEKSE